MTFGLSKVGVLSGNTLKFIAAVFMIVDHVGVILFPQIQILRIIGRLAFPIFAFMIAEGCKYTKNKLRHLLTVVVFAAAIQTVYYLYSGETKMSVFVTFSLSIAMIYALQYFKNELTSKESSTVKKLLAAVIFALSVCFSLACDMFLDIDYGFMGATLPLWVAIFHTDPKKQGAQPFDTLDVLPIHVLSFGLGLLLMSIFFGGVQYYSLLSLPLLMLYSGKRGKHRMKYFFYIFYPAHILVIYGISLLIK